MVASLQVVFFGTPEFAVPTLQALLVSSHAVCGVVTRPDRPRGRGQKVSHSPVKALALAHRLPVFQPPRLRQPDVLETVRAWSPDLGVVAAYGKIIPPDLLAVPRLGMINVHASLLPHYRGVAPVHRAVIDGVNETGVTIMRVVEELDAGDMLGKVRRPVGADETADVVERDLAELGAAVLVTTADALAAGPVDAEPQDFMVATYAPRLTKDEGLVDWTLPASYLHNRVRGLYPWPHAYTYLHGRRIILLTTHVGEMPCIEPPGTIVGVLRDAVEVATGRGGRLTIDRLQPEGRRPMAARDFLAGHALAPGSRFTGP